MKKIIFLLAFIFISGNCLAENYLLNGGQESQINYRITQRVSPAPGTKKIFLSYVKPQSFSSRTYSQRIENLNFKFSQEPSKKTEKTDSRGNTIIEVVFDPPLKPVTMTMTCTAYNQVKLDKIETTSPFPLTSLSDDVKDFLKGTEQVDIDDLQIKAKARELTAGSKTEFDAVQKILTYVVDQIKYVQTPKSYNAVYSLKTGRGNCQNYSHLSAALMRSVGIPVRIVNGVTLKKPYDIKTGRSILTMKMAQGRHSWIEVYFPDLGWMPFDPSGTVLFVSNRFIRIETGLDNNETENDGLIRWSYTRGTDGTPQSEENIEAAVDKDSVKIAGIKTDYGPRELLVSPHVAAEFSKVEFKPLEPPPPPMTDKELKILKYNVQHVFGNREFPRNINFLTFTSPASQGEGDTMKIKKNFMVETAEYVTTNGQQYAQTFILDRPLRLIEVGLALHKFGNEGQLWLELFKDNGGMPGEIMATSEFMNMNAIKYKPGYDWVNFDFSKANKVLSPGRYWVGLGFTGSAVVNWFFTYGKPEGPADGTRYKVLFDETWSRSLNFEFNYRVMGLTTSEFKAKTEFKKLQD